MKLHLPWLVAALAMFVCVDLGRAQTPNAQAPALTGCSPAGAKRGSTVDLELTGAHLADPTGLWTSFSSKANFPPEGENGKVENKLRVRLEIPKDAPMGFQTIRLGTTRGVSNFRIFCIDELPEVATGVENHSQKSAQPVLHPCVITGKSGVADRADYYKLTVKANERLSLEVLGRRLGSAFDPQLTLYDARSGKELPGGHSNDAPGLQTDPRLTYTFKEPGEYIVEVRDVSSRAGADFDYRLRIGDFPCATTPLPLAVKRGSTTQVGFAGPQVAGVAPVNVSAPTDPAVDSIWLTPRGPNGLAGWPVSLLLTDLDEAVEHEPNDDRAKANRLVVPAAVSGCLATRGDVDYFIFTSKKDSRYLIEIQTVELHSPADVQVTLKDGKGTPLQTTPADGSPRIDFKVPADGDYTISVEHVNFWGGPDQTYRLTVTPFGPRFEMTAAADRFDAAQGATANVPVQLVRHDFDGPVDVKVVSTAGLTGSVTIPAGQNAGVVPVKIAERLAVGPYGFRLLGEATINGKREITTVSVRTVASQTMNGLPTPPRPTWTQLSLAVLEKPPFTLTAKLEPANLSPGKPATLTVTAVRNAEFKGEIALALKGLPANIPAASKNIAADGNEAKIVLTPAADAVGKFAIEVSGKASYKGREITVQAPAIPFESKK